MYTPSVSVAPREASTSSKLGKYVIPPETKVMCNIYGAHRHPSIWDDHDSFNPMRFNEAPPGQPVKVRAMIEEGYFPFGYGGHGCIGKNLAQEAVLMMLAMLFSKFIVTPKPGTKMADFNTTNSAQILGFMEAVDGVHVVLRDREEASYVIDKTTRNRERDEEGERAHVSASGGQVELTLEEVQKHTSRESCWLVLNGKVIPFKAPP